MAGCIIFPFLCCNPQKETADPHPFFYSYFRNGDILCRLGNGYFSNYFKKWASEEKIYSHIGLVEIDGDSIFVYHSEASELTGIGSVRKETVSQYLNGAKAWGLYRISCSDSLKTCILQNVRAYFEKRTPFDLDFDLTNDSSVYCTELIALSINKAFQDSVITPTRHIGNFLFYGLDDIYKNEIVAPVNTSTLQP